MMRGQSQDQYRVWRGVPPRAQNELKEEEDNLRRECVVILCYFRWRLLEQQEAGSAASAPLLNTTEDESTNPQDDAPVEQPRDLKAVMAAERMHHRYLFVCVAVMIVGVSVFTWVSWEVTNTTAFRWQSDWNKLPPAEQTARVCGYITTVLYTALYVPQIWYHQRLSLCY